MRIASTLLAAILAALAMIGVSTAETGHESDEKVGFGGSLFW